MLLLKLTSLPKTTARYLHWVCRLVCTEFESNAKCKYLLLISTTEKIQIAQTRYGQKQAVQVTIMQEYCVQRTQVKYKMTERTNNGNHIV